MNRRFDLKKSFDQLKATTDPDLLIMIMQDFKKHIMSPNVTRFDNNEQMYILNGLLENCFTDIGSEVNDVALQSFVVFAPFISSERVVEQVFSKIFEKLSSNSSAKNIVSQQNIVTEMVKQTLRIFFINKSFAQMITNKFAVPIFNKMSEDLKKDAQVGYLLDTADTLVKFGGKLLDMARLVKIILPYIYKGNGANRRKAVQCIAHMSKYCSEENIDVIMESALDELSKCTSNDQMRVLVSLIQLIANEIKVKYVKYIPRTYQVLKGKFDFEEEDTENDDIKECILNTYNTMILATGGAVGDLVEPLIDVATEYLVYNPNVFIYSDEEEMEEMEEEEEMEFEDEDDVTWKLRKLAGEIITSLILKRVDVIDYILEKSLKNIVSKFTEKVDIVLNVVMNIYHNILVVINNGNSAKKEFVDATYENVFEKLKTILSSKTIGEKPKISALMIMSEMSLFNRELFVKHLKEITEMFVEMFNTQQSNIEIIFALCDSLKKIFVNCDTALLNSSISPILIKKFDEKNFRVAIEIIKTEEMLIEYAGEEEVQQLNIIELVEKLMNIVKSDKDHEVKDEAVNCIGVVLKRFLFTMGEANIKSVVDELFKLLDNTFLKSSALQVIEKIISTKLFEIIGNIDNILTKIIDQTKQATRLVKLGALNSAKAIVMCCENLKEQTIKNVLPIISSYIYDNDSYIVDVSVTILVEFAKRPTIAKLILNDSYKKVVEITKGSNARDSLAQTFMKFTEVMAQNAKAEVLEMVMNIQNHMYTKANLFLTGAMYAATKPNVDEVFELIKKNYSTYKGKVEQSAEYYRTIVHLYCLGQIALMGVVEKDKVVNTLLQYMKIDSDSIRQAASFALGNIPNIIPFIFEQLKTTKTHSMMNAMKEAVKYVKKEEVEDILAKLMEIKPDEKYIVPLSDSFGRLIANDPNIYVKKYYLPSLEAKEGNAALIGSIKGCMSACDPKLFIPLIPKIVNKLDNKIPAVKGALFSITSYLLTNARKDIIGYVPSIVEHLIPQTLVDHNYIQIAKFCQITHVIDTGLDSRKAVYDCLGVLIDSYLAELNYTKIANTIMDGITQEVDHDMKLLGFNMLTKLATLNIEPMIEIIEEYSIKLREMIKGSLDDKSKDSETPKQQEINKAVCRFVARVFTHPLANVANEFEKLVTDIANSAKLSATYKAMIPKNEGK